MPLQLGETKMRGQSHILLEECSAEKKVAKMDSCEVFWEVLC